MRKNVISSILTIISATVIATFADKSIAGTVTLVNNGFDSAPYTAVAQSSYTSTTVGLPSMVGVPDTNNVVIDGGLPYPGAAYGLGMDGVQVVNWNYHSAPNCMLVRAGASFRCNFDPRGGTNYTWDFWMLSSKSGVADRSFRIHLLGEGADQNVEDLFVFRSDYGTTASLTGTDGVDLFQSYNGIAGTTGVNSWMIISNTASGTWSFCTNNVWNHYRIVVNTVTFTAAYYVNDMVNAVNPSIPLSRPQQIPAVGIQFESGSDMDGASTNSYILIDDVSLTADGTFVDLSSGPITEGFETYPASTSANVGAATNPPGGAWLTAATVGVGNGKALNPTAVQVVDSSVVTPHSGNNCLMVSKGQTAGATISWAQATNQDVKITWWANVPATPNNNAVASVYLRVSLYGWEANSSSSSDTVLLGYGHRSSAPYGGANSLFTFSRWASTWYGAAGAWEDTGLSYTPNTWEQYQLTTCVSQNSFTISNLTQGVSVVQDGQFITSWDNVKKMHTLAFSSSNNTTPGGNPPAYIDDITIQAYSNPQTPLPKCYTPTITGTRFTNFTVVNIPGRTVGGVCVDPRDNTTIYFTIDSPTKGAVMRAHKIASGNWMVDSNPIVSGLNMAYPNSCYMDTNGTLWWVHDNRGGNTFQALRCLQSPFTSNSWQEIISDFGAAPTNAQDQPCDLVSVPSTFTGPVPQLAVLDRGVNGNNPNAIWLVDPATTNLFQACYQNALVPPNNTIFGDGLGGNADAMDALPATGELATIWEGDGVNDNGCIAIFNGSGSVRYILTAGSGITLGFALAVDPLTQRIWVADEKSLAAPSAFALPQIVSFDSTNGTPFTQEITFPNNNPTAARPDLRINFHDPGMRFSPDGKFLVVADQTLASDGGRLVIFDNEPFVIPSMNITSVNSTSSGINLTWTSGGAVNYVVQRSATVNGTYTAISPTLPGSTTSYTDTAPPANTAFYRVLATAQN